VVTFVSPSTLTRTALMVDKFNDPELILCSIAVSIAA
jgi:hypothetical protein